MKKLIWIIPFALLSGCWPFGSNEPLPDKRTQVPGATQVNNYLDQATSPASVHCVDDGDSDTLVEKTYFHDGYAKISSNHVGKDVSHRWDESWNGAIDEVLEEKFPELISDDMKIHEGELIQLGCGGFSVASKKDKKRFWALFLASLSRVRSGFDPSFKEGQNSGIFALNPNKMSSLGGECAGKDEIDFLEPSYSFGCALEGIKAHINAEGKIFSNEPNPLLPFDTLSGPKRFEFIKFFKSHAAPQFSFCTNGVEAPSELVTSNREGEGSAISKCRPEDQKRLHESLDRGRASKSSEAVESGSPEGQEESGGSTTLTK